MYPIGTGMTRMLEEVFIVRGHTTGLRAFMYTRVRRSEELSRLAQELEGAILETEADQQRVALANDRRIRGSSGASVVTFTLNAWKDTGTLAYDGHIKAFKVKDEFILGEASAAGGRSIVVDKYTATNSGKRLFNVWTVHQNEPVAVDVRVFPLE
eukprot:4893609-Pyramimonas_sp.AAC.1